MLIIHANAFIDGAFRPDTCIRMENETVMAVAPDLVPAENETVSDVKGQFVLPGFVDVHIHASAGHDTMNGKNDVLGMARYLGSCGVSAFLATTMTASAGDTRSALCGIKNAMREHNPESAFIAGAHMEGPFLAPERCGAQDPALLSEPSEDAFVEYAGDSADIVRMITIAPELPGASGLIRMLTGKGITVSAGHSSATAGELHAAADLGLSHATHLFNAQPALHHRKPGLVGAALTDPRVICEMICDGIHLHPDTVRLICAIKGASGAVAVTDAMEAAGMPDGEYSLGGQAVTVREGSARLADGTLAGSILRMKDAFRNLLSWGIAPEQVIPMCTSTPADSVGLKNFGRIRVGNKGCLTVWTQDWTMNDVLHTL